jgi:hypothetical protein
MVAVPTTVSDSAKPVNPQPTAAVRVLGSPRKPSRKMRPKSKPSLIQWHRRAHQLMKLAAGKWSRLDIDQLNALRAEMRAALRGERVRNQKKVARFLRILNEIGLLLQPRKTRDRGNPARHAHPDRNRITDYGAAGGRIRWATRKR